MKKFKLIQFVMAVCVIILSSCSNDDAQPEKPKNYVLVHGAWQAPFVWQSVKANLEKQGNKVVVVELPGHGADQTSPSQITLDVYKEKVINALSTIDGKVILVGHSLGGMIISSVAEAMPEKIEKLVYVAAYLPVSGQTLDQLAHMDPDSQLGITGNLIFNYDQGIVDVKQDQIVNLFIPDGTPEIQNLVLKNYRTEPLTPFINPVMLTDKNFGSVKKVYIKTLQDHVVSPYLQNKMIAAGKVESVYEINTGHSPFLSKPDDLSSILTKIASN
ncbi:alpha/beta hydrolase [Flavobacterium sp. WLB]|uniref:Alpha/beta hydrolase n=1 Tax=Flavobacterium panici TaxID=2654843 RepID=A0A9N8P2P1_9FLAO|nr:MULTISPECIES: alpha/beta fold hydrolase [Flavobacterium]KOP40001.1 alpha/beta hydrolase [Flavobacterium sp. VMW]OWU88461.1 alpha/beta hydrolase [Flavobacterium sp. NLM]PUU71522.1 alpha/beta hydrolase [Flavobacterium sp. WLB]CAC9975315.1 alpha/beta hydrolase [Flavobacterium panici]